MTNKLQETLKDQIGGSTAVVLKKGTNQIVRRPVAAPTTAKALDKLPTLIPNPFLVRRNDGKKKKDRRIHKKNGKSVPFAEFCADLGGDSPIPNNQ